MGTMKMIQILKHFDFLVFRNVFFFIIVSFQLYFSLFKQLKSQGHILNYYS